MGRTLTDEELAEVGRIITETVVQTRGQRDFDDIEEDDVYATLCEAARAVKAYLRSLKRWG